jgi:hypothetical protein
MNEGVSAAYRTLLIVVLSTVAVPRAAADAVVDCNIKAGAIVTEAKLHAPVANRVLAIMHAAAYEATSAITYRYGAGSKLEAARGLVVGERAAAVVLAAGEARHTAGSESVSR